MMSWKDEAAPPPEIDEKYGIAREHAFSVASVAVQKSMEQPTTTPCEKHILAGRLVLMEVNVAQAQVRIEQQAYRASYYMAMIRREEDSVPTVAHELGLSPIEIDQAVDIAVVVLRGIRTDPDVPIDLWGHIADVDASQRAQEVLQQATDSVDPGWVPVMQYAA